MKKSVKFIFSLTILLVVMTLALIPVYAASFNVTSTITQSPSTENRTATIALGYSGGTTRSIEGTINFDSDFFESVTFGNSGNWSVRQTGARFVATNTENTAESGQFAIITAKVKSNTTLTEGEIRLTELESGSTGISADKTIIVKMQATPSKPEDEGQPATPEAPANETPAATNNDNGGNVQPAKITDTKSNVKTTKLSNVSNLPKAGIISGIGIAIIAAIIVAIIELIKYKRITK